MKKTSKLIIPFLFSFTISFFCCIYLSNEKAILDMSNSYQSVGLMGLAENADSYGFTEMAIIEWLAEAFIYIITLNA